MTQTKIHWLITRFILATVFVVGVYGEAGVFTAVAVGLVYLWVELRTLTANQPREFQRWLRDSYRPPSSPPTEEDLGGYLVPDRVLSDLPGRRAHFWRWLGVRVSSKWVYMRGCRWVDLAAKIKAWAKQHKAQAGGAIPRSGIADYSQRDA